MYYTSSNAREDAAKVLSAKREENEKDLNNQVNKIASLIQSEARQGKFSLTIDEVLPYNVKNAIEKTGKYEVTQNPIFKRFLLFFKKRVGTRTTIRW